MFTRVHHWSLSWASWIQSTLISYYVFEIQNIR